MDQQRTVTVASLNTLGLPLRSAALPKRYGAIAEFFEASDIDVVCFQEVLTGWHLRKLAPGMPSFRHLRYRRGLVGPAGGLVTMSRRPLRQVRYHRFPFPVPGQSRVVQLKGLLKGSLVTRLDNLCIVNTHPMPNFDGDWSSANRHAPMHRQQLNHLARVVKGREAAVVLGDFNIAADSDLFRTFQAATGLVDAFAGDDTPTFRAEFLPPNATSHRIDFVLTTPSVPVVERELILIDKHPLPGGPAFLSDHLGLRATINVPAGPAAGT
jgi:endonuclease/exonuclease/phosphatase family metal-dependent hydrolase